MSNVSLTRKEAEKEVIASHVGGALLRLWVRAERPRPAGVDYWPDKPERKADYVRFARAAREVMAELKIDLGGPRHV